jgi:hypothetical protein
MRAVVLSLVVTALAGVPQSPQPARPDLSGHWVADPVPDDQDGRIPICQVECVMTQSADALLVRSMETDHTFTYKFDGSPTNPPPAKEGDHRNLLLVFRTSWKSNVLVIESTSGTYKTTARLSLAAGRLTIDGERSSGQPGPKFKQAYRKLEKD